MLAGAILPSSRSEVFRPLTYQMPAGLLPIVNRPLLEHQIHLLVQNGVDRITVSCNHLASRVESTLGTGDRFAAQLTFAYEVPPYGSVAALRRIGPAAGGATLVVVEGDVIGDADIDAAVRFHRERRADATFFCRLTNSPGPGLTLALDGAGQVRAVRLNGSPAASAHLVDAGICILEPEMLDLLPDREGYGLLQACWLASKNVRLNLYGFQTGEPIARLVNWKTYYKVQHDILEGRYPGIRIPGTEVRPGLWIGENVRAAGSVVMTGPALIGDNCVIGRNVMVGEGTVLGSGVQVGAGSRTERSIVLPRTRVSGRTTFRDAVVQGNLLIDVQRSRHRALSGDGNPPRIDRAALPHDIAAALQRCLAALLLVAFAPVFLLVVFPLLLVRRRPLVARVRRLGTDIGDLARGSLRLRVFDLFYFGPIGGDRHPAGHPFDPPTVLPGGFARLGNLLNVVRGDILIIGNRPMDPELAFSITEEWQRTRFKAPAGMISVFDAAGYRNLTPDERYVQEGYYAVERTLPGDAALLVRALGRGVRSIPRLLRRLFEAPKTPR